MGRLRHKAIKFIAFGKHPQIGLCSSCGDPLLAQPSTGRCLPDLICPLPDPLLICANYLATLPAAPGTPDDHLVPDTHQPLSTHQPT